MMSKLVQDMSEDSEDTDIHISNKLEWKLCRRLFQFCDKYINNPYSDITHPLDDQKALPNYYNDFLDDLTPNSVISLLQISDYLNILPLLKLICFKLAYLMRDMSCEERLNYFNIHEPTLLQNAEM